MYMSVGPEGALPIECFVGRSTGRICLVLAQAVLHAWKGPVAGARARAADPQPALMAAGPSAPSLSSSRPRISPNSSLCPGRRCAITRHSAQALRQRAPRRQVQAYAGKGARVRTGRRSP